MQPAASATSLRDGSTVAIRPIEPGDGDRLVEIWAGLSELSRRRRFLTPAQGEAREEDLAYLTDVDHRRHEALLALDSDGRAVGVARYVRTPGDRGSAEVAVVVVDAWHGRGLGRTLLERLTERARENGIERYTAIVSQDNEIVLGALERAGAERTGITPDGEVELSLELPSEGIGERLAASLRAAATAPRAFVGAIARRAAVWRWF